jgi:hypothetical protein
MTWLRSNTLAVLAIVIALSSGAYAVTTAPKDSVVSKSIKNGAVKSKDLASRSVNGSKVKDGSLTGADIDESTLVVGGDKVDQVTLRLPANTPTAPRASHNGLTVVAGCLGANGAMDMEVQFEAGVGVHEYPGEGTFEADGGPATRDLAEGVVNGAGAGTYYYRRASDGAGVTVDYVWTNDSASPGSLVNTDCVVSLTITYTQS